MENKVGSSLPEWQDIVHSRDIIIYVRYPDGAILRVNDVALDTYGYSRAEMLQLNIRDLRADDALTDLTLQLEQAFRYGLLFETRHKRKDGTVFPVEVSSGCVRGPGEQIVLSIIRDITERKRVEQQLAYRQKRLEDLVAARAAELDRMYQRLWRQYEHSEEMERLIQAKEETFMRAFHGSSLGKALISRSGRFLDVNDAVCNMLGYSRQEILSMGTGDFLHPEDGELAREQFRRLAEGLSPYCHFDMRTVHQGGQVVWTQTSITLLKGWQGEQSVLLVELQDITRRKETAAELQQLARIVEAADNAIYSWDLDGNILSWNKAAERIFGYSAAEMRERTISALVPINLRDEFLAIRRQLQDGEPMQQIETKRLRKDGSLIDVTITVSPIPDSSGDLGSIVSITRDITARKALERELARLDRLDLVAEMAASISHEVRNPMTTVRGYLQILGYKPELVPYQSQLALMIEELDRMNEIITEFLSLSRHKQVELMRANLNQEVKALLPLIKADALLQGKELAVELGEIQQELFLDRKEIRQLILNLVRNAFEAMVGPGCVTIQTLQAEDSVVLAVEDQGCGIPQEVMEKLGTPFFSTKDNGTGLGLAVCYSIVRRHQATIIPSTGEWGTRFEVHFPCS